MMGCVDIFVPPEQIIDTVNIYHIEKRQRKLGLRLLAWIVLGLDIQSQGSHDSIEDAKTALRLYLKYKQLRADGKWEESLEEIYREGKRVVSFFLLHCYIFCEIIILSELESPKRRTDSSSLISRFTYHKSKSEPLRKHVTTFFSTTSIISNSTSTKRFVQIIDSMVS
jgi:hypothetical protein